MIMTTTMMVTVKPNRLLFEERDDNSFQQKEQEVKGHEGISRLHFKVFVIAECHIVKNNA